MKKAFAPTAPENASPERRPRTAFILFLLLLSAVCLAGCGRSPQPRYYMLGGAQKAHAPQQTETGRGVLLRRVSLPAYLDRDAIVLRREDAVELTVAEYHLWAEPLGKTVPRLLEETMTPVLQEGGLTLLWPDAETDAALSADVAVLRFDASPEHTAELQARWRILDREGGLLDRGLFGRTREAGGDYGSMVRNMSLLVEDLGRELARASLDVHGRGQSAEEKNGARKR